MSAPRESLLALAAHDLTFRADGTETVDGEDAREPAGFTPGETLRARYLEHRVTARGVVYRFARVPGGRFEIFERVGMPPGMRKAPELRRVVDRAS
jgi:hypothetical protein